jgi:hypothetical protein
LTIEGLARLAGPSAALLCETLPRVEAGEAEASPVLLQLLRFLFPFDPNVYNALRFRSADSTIALPPICRRCACTEFDPCFDEMDEPCGWARVAAGEPPLCTLCIGDAPAAPPAIGLGEEGRSHAA